MKPKRTRSSRMLGTNPRALGTNPRATGRNPRALGTNPSMKNKRDIDELREAVATLFTTASETERAQWWGVINQAMMHGATREEIAFQITDCLEHSKTPSHLFIWRMKNWKKNWRTNERGF